MTKLGNKIYFAGLKAKNQMAKLMKNESGEANIIAIIIVLAIVIALAIIFRGAIMDLFDTIWDKITGDVEDAI